MSENSKIEWTTHTFNPWVGCTKISPACDHCYAESWAKRSGAVTWGSERKRTSVANWAMPLQWNRIAAETGTRPRVFCASLADVFDNQVPLEWRRDLFALIDNCRNLDWLLLTKRIGKAHDMLNTVTLGFWEQSPWPHVWLGATVCNQEEADRDIPKLLATPARVRFLSAEPMLGPIDLRFTNGLIHGHERDAALDRPYRLLTRGGSQWVEEFDGQPTLGVWIMHRVGKKAAGRLLDGVLHDGYPTA